jgi:putative membrane protein
MISIIIEKGGGIMKGQWSLILALVFALIVAMFSVLNVEEVKVRYFIGEAFVSIPLIIVIIASTLIGGLIVGAVGIVRVFSLQMENRQLKNKLEQMSATISDGSKTPDQESILLAGDLDETEEKKVEMKEEIQEEKQRTEIGEESKKENS